MRLRLPEGHPDPRIAAAAVFAAIVVAACITIAQRSAKGRGAFVRWTAATEGLADGTMIYRRLDDASGMDEGYPNPPLMGLILMPFHAVGVVPGSVLWTLVKAGIAVFVFLVVWRWPRGHGPPFPRWAALVLVLLSAQVLHLDLTHGNTNLLVAGCIGAALLASRSNRDLQAGLWIGLGGVLKVTPLLFLPYFLWKRRPRALLGVGLGIGLFAWVVPGMLLGFEANHALLVGWYDQMIAPFLSGSSIGYMQTGYMNQSFTGVFHRLLGDTVAVWANEAKGVSEIRVNLASLAPAQVGLLVRGLSLVVLGVVAWACRPRRTDRRGMAQLGEFALVFLAMLFLSERSWRTHYILLLLPQAFLLYELTSGRARGAARRWVLAALIGSALTHHGAYDELFGDRVGVLLECYGVFLWGGLFLFGVAAWRVRGAGSESDAAPSASE